jgi:hypothetical protein
MITMEDSRDTAHETVPAARRYQRRSLRDLVELLVGQCERHASPISAPATRLPCRPQPSAACRPTVCRDSHTAGLFASPAGNGWNK